MLIFWSPKNAAMLALLLAAPNPIGSIVESGICATAACHLESEDTVCIRHRVLEVFDIHIIVDNADRGNHEAPRLIAITCIASRFIDVISELGVQGKTSTENKVSCRKLARRWSRQNRLCWQLGTVKQAKDKYPYNI